MLRIPTIKFMGLMALVVVLGGCSVFGRSGVETPDYSVIKSSDPFEVREYAALRVAETTAARAETSDGSMREPFMRLFRYIDGGNAEKAKISMTAPVLISPDDTVADQRAMAFIVPKSHQANTPAPASEAVSVKDVPARTVAVVTFSGSRSSAKAEAEEQKLRDWMAAEGLVARGPAIEAYYNPPWTIPFMRRNEVLIPIEP